MKIISSSEFKSKCLEIMDEVAASGEEVVITKNGVPVGKFVPYALKPKTLRGLHAGQVRANYDLIASSGEPSLGRRSLIGLDTDVLVWPDTIFAEFEAGLGFGSIAIGSAPRSGNSFALQFAS